MQIYCNKIKHLLKKRVQLPGDWFGTPTWPPFHCFGTLCENTLVWMVCGLEGPGVEFKVRLMSQPNQVNAHASDATIILNTHSIRKHTWFRYQCVAQYPDGTSIRTLKTKTQFLRRPFQFSVNEVFRMNAEHFSFKMKVLASLKLAKQSQKTPFCSGE